MDISLTQAWGVERFLNQQGKPTQNAHVESFNGKFRDERLNEHWFETLAQSRDEIASWPVDFDEVIPRTRYGRIPGACFAALQRQQAADAAHPQRAQE